MRKFSLLTALFLVGITTLSAQHHGLGINVGGGMVNTINDAGKNPDEGIFSANVAYLIAEKKEDKKYYSLTRIGVGYEIGGAFQGFSLFADSGLVLFDLWRVGAGLQLEMVTGLDNLLKNGLVIMPYFETGIMWPVFDNAGFDFGFKLGAPVKLTAKLVDPFYQQNKMDQLNWAFTLGYFHFFEGKKHD